MNLEMSAGRATRTQGSASYLQPTSMSFLCILSERA